MKAAVLLVGGAGDCLSVAKNKTGPTRTNRIDFNKSPEPFSLLLALPFARQTVRIHVPRNLQAETLSPTLRGELGAIPPNGRELREIRVFCSVAEERPRTAFRPGRTISW